MPKNLCRNCGEDFYRVTMFDAHRKNFKLIGESRELVGDCIAPQLLGYHERSGVWYDDEGLRTWEKLVAARAAKKTAERNE